MLPTKINSYNVYSQGTKLVGVSDEVTLPDFEALTETISGPGLLGEMDDPLLGHFGAAEIEIPFRTMNDEMFNLVQQSNSVDLTLRISTQAIEQATSALEFMPSRVVIRGRNKGFTGGSVKSGQGTGSSVKADITYILIEINGKSRFELDKLNFVYKVDGVDLLEEIRKQV
jgi:hypothetical protein